MWNKLMVRIWAFFHERAYREKAILSTIVFVAALILAIEIGTIATGGKISVFGLLMLVIICTTGLYSAIELKVRAKNGNEEN